jgi:D-glycero-alpha-D-manno-heptose-7-phosphate kinase
MCISCLPLLKGWLATRLGVIATITATNAAFTPRNRVVTSLRDIGFKDILLPCHLIRDNKPLRAITTSTHPDRHTAARYTSKYGCHGQYRTKGTYMAITTYVLARAPVRVLDAGGWTDTWFAGNGTVCNLAVDDGVEVSARRQELSVSRGVRMVDLRVPGFGDQYCFALNECPGRHPLLEAALSRWAPPDCQIEVIVTSSVPPGSGVGTSASVVVALIAALWALADRNWDLAALARASHEIETLDCGLQCGVEDQVAAAYGGCNLIRIDPYPHVEVHSLELAPSTWDALGRRIVTVYLGSPHRSSTMHEAVIEGLTSTDAEMLLAPLRTAASNAAAALVAGDISAYGSAMIANTEAQAALHPALVNELARKVITVAEGHGAIGWKVNGAGGNGGTVTIIGRDDAGELVKALASISGLSILPLLPAKDGVRIVDKI